ncbi:hypothetical protein HS088_TW10G00853 [Tripterygium wilfordii]|uniref:Cupin type-1 domain-containing protein n=1 Tax=Tripterygium wilfordii TaxID=458696 RepID=A0A7J7D670_TRIWF|nr:11S globulin seed storage protein 2-like [Tripterygium wilfordii]KAF5741847.1 hypothetical protein HS088_TW10G00853 [Tripterygium wilfordii]
MASKLLALALLSLFVYAAVGDRQSEKQQQRDRDFTQKCRLQRITRSQPSQRFESEGGVTEIWDQDEDQFQCAGFATMRHTVKPNSLSLPKFSPAPSLVYIEQGSGMLGITIAGCPETFHSTEQGQRSRDVRSSGQQRDQHQKVRRFRKGDIIVAPAGAASWCYNDGDEDVIAVTFHDLTNSENQLDWNLREFMLAGGLPRQRMQERRREGRRGTQSQRVQDTFQNVLRPFDQDLLSEALNVPSNIVQQMQQEDNRGLIVRCEKEMMRMISPEEEQEEGYELEHPRGGRNLPQQNGMEETYCSMKFKTNMDARRKSDFYGRGAGGINIVSESKLPILQYLHLSAEKGHLMPNALFTPHWTVNEQTVFYTLRGEAQVQIVDHRGNTVMDERVKEGDMHVLPQYYACVMRAGSEGYEWMAVKTSSRPEKSPMAGYTSVLRGMPNDVLANAFQISPSEARQLKTNRDPQSLVLTPVGRISS